MQKEKKEFTKAEVEVVRFEKNDVITTSPTGCNPALNEVYGGGANVIDDDEDIEG